MKKLLLVALSGALSLSAISQVKKSSPDSIFRNFITPPNAAQPRVWWHWMNGNITQTGIRKDLEWMHSVGIGGFQNFDAALATPQIVPKRLTYMTPEWIDAFRLTTKLADSLHLEMAIAGSPGWSESGGPWVKPENGMKKIVWTELRVKAGDKNIRIAPAAGITGPFQNIPMQPGFGETVEQSRLPVFYKDIAVVAFRVPAAGKSLSALGAVVSSSAGQFTLAQLTDGDLGVTSLLPRDTAAGFAWIRFAFPAAQTIKAITIVGGGASGPFGMGAPKADSRKLEASDDGTTFRLVCIIPPGAIAQQSIKVPATTAKFFRVRFDNPPPPVNLAAAFGIAGAPAPKDPGGTEVAEIRLHPEDIINRYEEKDAFAPVGDLNAKMTEESNDTTDTKDIIDLTSKMQPDGSISWSPADGEWKIVRFGYSLLGITNHPASPEATGFEVDKLDPVAVKNYFENYLDQYVKATGGLMGDKGGLKFMVTDSWEAGAQNWTDNLPAEFEKRRGYSIINWLPVLTGSIVKSAQASEQFLFDFRKTLSEMVAAYHYDALTGILAARGMKRYSESHESGRAIIADGMEVKRTAAVPMSALWTPNAFINQFDQTPHTIDIRESGSVAHLYGQNLVAAESLTALGIGGSAWSYYPENLKPSVDLELASGLNRFVIHCSVHQPTDDKIPGLGLGPFGQWYNRHETWATQAVAWNAYLSRSSYLLQQGHFVADVLYYYGEDNNVTALFGKHPPVIPEGYNYDFINADALVNLLSVKNGMLVTPSGMTYKILFLDSNAARMSLPVLKKIAQLAKDGATIAGIKPTLALGLSDEGPEFSKLVAEIWTGSSDKISSGKPVADVVNAMTLAPDFAYSKTGAETKLLYVHRRLTDRDIYWVNSRTDAAQDLEATFRVEGKIPVIWHPETATTELVSYEISNGLTKVQLHLQPNDAIFVVFKDKAIKTSVVYAAKQEKQLLSLDGSWQVAFQKERGAPASVSLDKLASFSENAEPGIKYFSGTATYSKTVNADKNWFAEKQQIWLDLGEVKNLAEVLVNGKPLGIVWKKPFRVDISNALKAGNNSIVVKVTDLWVNRLIGDAQPNTVNKITYTTMPFYQAGSPLQPAGLLGPVQILSLK